MNWTQQVYYWLQNTQPSRRKGSCCLCSAQSEDTIDLCRACRNDFLRNPHACPGCARPLIHLSDKVCGHCVREPPPYTAFAPFLYAEPLDRLIIDFKFHGRLYLGRTLGELLAAAAGQLTSPPPDVLVPVPLHPSRLRERGFNQAVELTRPLSRRLTVPVRPGSVRRVRHTPGQSGLSAKERRRNVRGSFRATVGFEGKRVGIVDDVLTTGATARELAKCLLEAGAGSVSVWTLARTSEDN